MTRPSLPSPILIEAESAAVVDRSTFDALPTSTRRIEVVCNGGDRFEARWIGVSLPALLEVAAVPERTTHVLVESADGYRVCVDVPTAFDAMIAVGRDGRPLTDADGYESRFVGEDVPGPRAVRDVRRIETVSLAPGDRPDSYEDLQLAPDGADE